jgi:hypothetical protein
MLNIMDITIQEKLNIALNFLDGTPSTEDIRQAYKIIEDIKADLDESLARYNAHLTGNIIDVRVDRNEKFEEIE